MRFFSFRVNYYQCFRLKPWQIHYISHIGERWVLWESFWMKWSEFDQTKPKYLVVNTIFSAHLIARLKDTTSSLLSTLSETKTNCTCFPQFFNHIFLHMSRKYVSVSNEEYVLDQWKAFSHGCVVLISFHFLLQSSKLYWPLGLGFW